MKNKIRAGQLISRVLNFDYREIVSGGGFFHYLSHLM